MSGKVGLGLYALGALWLAAFIAYLVYLLLPFGVGLLSALFAALVAFGTFAWLVRSLVWRPLRRGGPLGRRRLAVVLTLAAATLALDAGWAHYLVPLPPTDQDDCTFGPIGPREFRALEREMSAKFNPDWAAAIRGGQNSAAEFQNQLQSILPKVADEAAMIAHIHALARSIGAELNSGGKYANDGVFYYYRLDLNRLLVRRVVFRWAWLTFWIKQTPENHGMVSLEAVWFVLPGIKGPVQTPPRERSCPHLPT
jgi:hypothetical protein